MASEGRSLKHCITSIQWTPKVDHSNSITSIQLPPKVDHSSSITSLEKVLAILTVKQCFLTFDRFLKLGHDVSASQLDSLIT